MNCIIYKENHEVVVLMPAPEAIKTHTVEEIAIKDVPAGFKYKIIDTSQLPSDFTFSAAWEIDDSELTDGVGGEHDMFITDPQHPDYIPPNQNDAIEGEVTE